MTPSSVAPAGKVTLLADADTPDDYVIKAIATTPGGAYNQNVTATVVAVVTGGTASVNGPTELAAALASAVSGDTLTLAAGSYGALNLTKTFTSYVTIAAANPASPPVFTGISLTNCNYIKFDGVHVSATSNGGSSSKVFNATGCNHIQFTNGEVNGLVDSDYAGWYGFYMSNCTDTTFSDSYLHDVANGVVGFGVTGMTITGNLIDYIGTDCFKFGGVHTVLIEDNTVGGHNYPTSTAHADFMQFQGQATDTTIRGNVYLALTAAKLQGIFFGSSDVHNNLLIEDNLIATGQTNSIRVNDVSTNVTVRYNTLITVPGIHSSASIITPAGSTVQNNIRTVETTGSDSGTNLVLQYSNPAGSYYVGNCYSGVTSRLGLTIEDFAIVPASAAETRGAYNRIGELLA